MVLYSFSVIPAWVVSYKTHRMVAKVTCSKGIEYRVHAPTACSGLLVPGAQVRISPIDNPKICSHRILCILTQDGWAGANPIIGELATIRALKLGLIDGYRLLDSPRGPNDAVCMTEEGVRPVEIKCVQTYYPVWEAFVFPTINQLEDSSRILENRPYANPISQRSVRQFRELANLGGHVIFSCIGPKKTHQATVVVNPLDQKLFDGSKNVTCIQILLEWSEDGAISFVGGPKKMSPESANSFYKSLRGRIVRARSLKKI